MTGEPKAAWEDQGLVARYPADLDADATTATGVTVHLRPIRPEDAPRLVAFHGGLSPESIYRRFFSVHPRLSDAEVERFTNVDYVDRFALIAEDGDRLVGVGRYERMPGTEEAEVAFVVADDHQHHGIGTTLLEHLAAAAWCSGVRTFVASTMADNRQMLHVFADSGFRVTRVLEAGIIDVRFPIEPDDAYRAACAARRARGEAPPAEAPPA